MPKCETCDDYGIVMYVMSERCAQGAKCPDCDTKPPEGDAFAEALAARKIRTVEREPVS